MDDQKIGRTRITALLYELRSWEPGESKRSVKELSRMFKLETWVVQQIARSEGVILEYETGDEEGIPEHADEEADTGVYRHNPSTGEFERIESEDSGDTWTNDEPDP